LAADHLDRLFAKKENLVVSMSGSLVRSAATRLLGQLGFELRRIRNSRHAHVDAFADQRRLFKDANPVIFDVGAHRGQSLDRYLAVFPSAEIYSFEPAASAFAELLAKYGMARQIHLHQQALSDSTGETVFHLNRADYTNSLLAAATGSDALVDGRLMEEVEKVRVNTTTVAAFVNDHSISSLDILKLDVQGAELLVLQGADPLLSRGAIALVLTEVQFAPLYSGQSYFDEVSAFLRKRGYSLYGLYDVRYGENGLLAWADALFASQACLRHAGLRLPGPAGSVT
jgi:FkbM family methyltransferase